MVIFFFIGKTRHDDDVSDELLKKGRRDFSPFSFPSEKKRLLSSAFQKNIALYGTQCKSLLGQQRQQKRARDELSKDIRSRL